MALWTAPQLYRDVAQGLLFPRFTRVCAAFKPGATSAAPTTPQVSLAHSQHLLALLTASH
eukprot:scaffold90922_cov75-Phaeocystis_antarctica.AAC.5